MACEIHSANLAQGLVYNAVAGMVILGLANSESGKSEKDIYLLVISL